MSLETDLVMALKTVCIRTFPDVAPANTTLPYITWQQVGGEAPIYLDKTLPDQRNAYIQVNVWAETRVESIALMLQVEQTITAATAFNGWPMSAMQATYEEDVDARGSIQDFEIWAVR